MRQKAGRIAVVSVQHIGPPEAAAILLERNDTCTDPPEVVGPGRRRQVVESFDSHHGNARDLLDGHEAIDVCNLVRKQPPHRRERQVVEGVPGSPADDAQQSGPQYHRNGNGLPDRQSPDAKTSVSENHALMVLKDSGQMVSRREKLLRRDEENVRPRGG